MRKLIYSLVAAILAGSSQAPAYFYQLGSPTFNQSIYDEAVKGNPDAMNDVGFWYLLGQGVAPDRNLGLEWLGKAADEGSVAAYMNLSDYYMNDGRDYVEARKWLLKADSCHVEIAAWNLGVVYQDQRSPFRDDFEAMRWFEKARSQNVNTADALMMIGICHDNLNQKALAKDFFVQYAENEANRTRNPQYYGLCMHKLGEYAWSGKADGLKDPEQAFQYFKQSYDLGYETAFVDMGNCYASGRGVESDSVKALEYYQIGIDKYNNLECRQKAAAIYAMGVARAGMAPDTDKAHALLAGYADTDPYSGLLLGTIMYQRGQFDRAVDYLQKARANNSGRIAAFAAFQLYKCFRNGYGVEQNIETADAMLNEARDRGCELVNDVDQSNEEIMRQLLESLEAPY